MTTYKFYSSTDNEVHNVLRDDTISIPFDLNNYDYRSFLVWLHEGNTIKGEELPLQVQSDLDQIETKEIKNLRN